MKRKRKPISKKNVIVGALATGAVVGLFFTGRYFWKKYQRDKAESTSNIMGDPSNFAKMLKMAFDNNNYFSLGTSVDKVYEVYKEIPSYDFFKLVGDSYKSKYGTNLNADLEDELTTYEMSMADSILKKNDDEYQKTKTKKITGWWG